MQAFLEFVVKGLVDHPEKVLVSPKSQGDSTVFELRLDSSDVGRVIGKQGSTIHAIRGLLQVGSAKQGKRCSLEIVEEESAGPS